MDVWELDLASLASVRSFASRFCKEDRQLDLLVCNAGIMAPPGRAETGDGLELQFQVLHATPSPQREAQLGRRCKPILKSSVSYGVKGDQYSACAVRLFQRVYSKRTDAHLHVQDR